MTTNVLTELKNLVGGKTATKRIVEVVSYDANSGKVTYKSNTGLGTFVSDAAYSPGDQLVMDGDKIIGYAEPISNTIWLD